MKHSLLTVASVAGALLISPIMPLAACGTVEGERKDEPVKGGEVEGKGHEVVIQSWQFKWQKGPFEVEHTVTRQGPSGAETVVVKAHGEVTDNGDNWRITFSKVTLGDAGGAPVPKDVDAALRAGGSHAFADAWPTLIVGKADGVVARVEGLDSELNRVREAHPLPKGKRAPTPSESTAQRQALETLAMQRWSAWVLLSGWDAPIGQARQFTTDADATDGLSVPLTAAERRLPLTAGLERAEIVRTYAGDALTKKVKADLAARGEAKAKLAAVTRVVREQTITTVTDPATLRSQRIEQRDVITVKAFTGKNEKVDTITEGDAWVFTW